MTQITTTVTVVKMKGKYAMFDSAMRVQPTAGLLAAKNMKALIGPMAKDTNAQQFPERDDHLPKPELAWTGPSVPQPAQGISNRVKATSRMEKIQQIDGDKEVVGGVRFDRNPGHTPGHTSHRVGSGKQQLR